MTAALMDFAQGRVSEYVRSDIGATSPGRWQLWQLFCRIGKMSLLKVGETGPAVEAAMAAAAVRNPAQNIRTTWYLRKVICVNSIICDFGFSLRQRENHQRVC